MADQIAQCRSCGSHDVEYVDDVPSPWAPPPAPDLQPGEHRGMEYGGDPETDVEVGEPVDEETSGPADAGAEEVVQ